MLISSFRHIILGSVSALALALPSWADKMHPVTGEALAEDQSFIYSEPAQYKSIDPQLAEETVGAAIIRDLFEGLYNQDADGNLEPGVALGHSVSDDKMTYTFNLRDTARWSNGDPVTAHDFVYGWRRATDPALASKYAWYIELMSIENAGAVLKGEMSPEALGVRALDDHTLEVKLTAPLPYFPQMVTHFTSYPAHRASIETHGDKWTRPENMVSNGAYMLTEDLPGERLTRARNPMYWNNDNTIIDKVVMHVVNDQNTALTRYLAGEFEFVEIPAGQYPRLKKEFPDEATSLPRLCNYYYTFNQSDSGPEVFKNPDIRKALSLAVDRKIIVENITAGGQTAAFTFTPVKTADFVTPDVPMANMSQAERDALAVELLAKAGYGKDNPLKFDMIYNTLESHKKIAIALSQMWKQKLGVQASLGNMEWKAFLEKRKNQEFELARGAWCGDYNEASTFLDLMTSQSSYNDGRYKNAEVDALMAEAKTSDSPATLYAQVERILDQEAPIIPIYHYAGVYMIDSDIGNWPRNNIEWNWYSKNLYKRAE